MYCVYNSEEVLKEKRGLGWRDEEGDEEGEDEEEEEDEEGGAEEGHSSSSLSGPRPLTLSSRFRSLSLRRVPRRRVPRRRVPYRTETPAPAREFTPEKSTDSRKISFRFRCPGSGAFRCSSTGLVFVVTKEAELQYKPVQWDEALLQSSGRTPAGPLYDIECPERALCELHLPHCEPEHADLSQSHLSVAHISDPGLSLVEPERITQTHVVISVRELSLFGLVWNIFIKHREVSGQVLLFCTPQKHKVNMFLLPRNISVDQVRSKQRSTTQYIDAPPKCKLVIDRHYSVVCPGAKKIQPPRALFDMDHEPNFHQSFELRLPPDSGPLSIAVREEGSTEAEKREVWGYELDLTEPPGSADPSPQRDSRTRLSSVRSEFVSRVSDAVLKQLLDKLQEEKVLNIEEAERASVCQTSADKARHLVDVVLKKGDGAASVLIKAFCDLDPRSALCQKLKDS